MIEQTDREAANKAFDVAFAAQGTAEQIKADMAEVLAAHRLRGYNAGLEAAAAVGFQRAVAGGKPLPCWPQSAP